MTEFLFLLFIPASLCYASSALISNYTPIHGNPPLYYSIGIGLSVMANLIWLTMAKYSPDAHTRYIYSLYWDSIIILSYALIPVFVFDLKLEFNVIIGIFFMFLGMLLIKI